jgi:hypothetical protein
MVRTFCSNVCLAVVATFSLEAIADLSGYALWETSADNGVTWAAGNRVVDQTVATIRARLLIGWDNATLPDPTSNFILFRDADFTAVVTGIGSGDVVPADSVRMMWNGQFVTPFIPYQLHVKPDWIGMLAVHPSQSPIFGIPDTRNPLRVFEFQLNLDGMTGRRDIFADFLILPSTGTPWIRVWNDQQTSVLFTNLTHTGASVTVIPTPAFGHLGVVACCLIAARRRRRPTSGFGCR